MAMHPLQPTTEAERSVLGGISGALPDYSRPCPVCGRPLTGRQRSACSDRCRAAKSRYTSLLAFRERLFELRSMLDTLLKETNPVKPEGTAMKREGIPL
jgi:predicted nucleic acid-binding Zn ribbon protein